MSLLAFHPFVPARVMLSPFHFTLGSDWVLLGYLCVPGVVFPSRVPWQSRWRERAGLCFHPEQ